MARFNNICNLTDAATATTESIEKPIKDWVQDAWLACLEQLSRDGKHIEDATTVEDLIQAFAPHAALIVSCYYQSIAQTHRDQKGHKNSPRKRALLEEAFSLDGFNPEGEPWSELIEDFRAEIPFRHIEDSDRFTNDPRIQGMTQKERDAVNRFIVAFFLKEAGYELPRSVRNKLDRDRKATGLSLAIGAGRQAGQG